MKQLLLGIIIIFTMSSVYAVDSYESSPLELFKQKYMDVKCSFDKQKCRSEMHSAFISQDIKKTEVYLKSGLSPDIIFEWAFGVSGYPYYFLWENTQKNRQYKSTQQKSAFDLFIKYGGELTDTYFEAAMQSSNLQVVKTVFSDPNLRMNRRVGYEILSSHIEQGNIDIIKYLVEQKVVLRPTDKWGKSLLTKLASLPLYSKGLIFDVFEDQLSVAKFLIDNGAEVNHFNDDWTPLMMAIKRDRYALVKLLIENGANVNIGYGDGETPLTLAVQRDFLYVKLLVENGADVSRPNKRGLTPLFLSKDNRYRKTIYDYLKFQIIM